MLLVLWGILVLMGCRSAGSGPAVSDGNETQRNVARSRYRHYLAVTVAPDGTLYAVGHNGTIARQQPGASEWTVLPTGTERSLFDVSFPTSREGWVVGAVGVILHTPDGGASWLSQTSGTEKELLAVAFVDATHGWAVGAAGTMLETH
ncbi:MAG: YCF48-related protein, partial [Candidatus Binatia bacterium]|nr:YCF48-related protein [Candidatus Binatia bacterium]